MYLFIYPIYNTEREKKNQNFVKDLQIQQKTQLTF